jgi:SAM-dependent methyltransferase
MAPGSERVDPGTLQFYRENAEAYAEWTKVRPARLTRFLSLLPPRCAVLELGCGAGYHAAVILAQGFVLRATDGSPEMAELAARRLGHPVETMLFHELDARDAYDGVWASACLLHVLRDELADVLARIRIALKPAGVFYASFKLGEADGRDRLGRYYNYPSRQWLESLYDATGGWDSIAAETGEIEKSFDGSPATMLHLTVRKFGA